VFSSPVVKRGRNTSARRPLLAFGQKPAAHESTHKKGWLGAGGQPFLKQTIGCIFNQK